MKTWKIFSPMDIRAAHINILRSLYRFQVLTTDLVIRSVGSSGSASTVKPNIQMLEKHGYLARFKLATPVGNSPYVCVLAENGMKYLRDEYGYDMRFYKPASEWKGYSSNFLYHPLELNKFIIAASKITAYDSRIQLLSWERDYELQSDPFVAVEPNGGIHRVVNDIILQFSVRMNQSEKPKRRIIIVEHERETHRKKAFLDKLRGLYWVVENGIFEKRYNHPIPRIAFTSSVDMDHVRWMRGQTKELLTDIRGVVKPDSIRNRMFFFGLIPSLQGKDIDVPKTFLEQSWQHPIYDPQKQLYSLLDI